MMTYWEAFWSLRYVIAAVVVLCGLATLLGWMLGGESDD